MKTYPKVFIVILNHEGQDYIQRCLNSVFKMAYPSFEVVLVDNDSKDGSLEIAKSNFSKANFIRNPKNLGFAAGMNIGIRFSLERMADYVLVLNNDVEVEQDFLEKLVEVGESDKKIGILSPIIFDQEKRRLWFGGGRIDWFRMKTEHSQKIQMKDHFSSDFITGCAMLVKAQVFKKIGLFDEDFFLYWEDADFSYRSASAGFQNVVVSSSWVYHAEKSAKNIKNKTYWLVFSGLLFFKKNAPGWLKPWLKFYVFLRKTKNKKDLADNSSELATIVKKAYDDFFQSEKR